MPNKKNQKSSIKRLTINQEYKYPFHSSEIGEIEFTFNFNTGYYKDLTFKKVKGGGKFGGNYVCVEQNDEYKISKY